MLRDFSEPHLSSSGSGASCRPGSWAPNLLLSSQGDEVWDIMCVIHEQRPTPLAVRLQAALQGQLQWELGTARAWGLWAGGLGGFS